jgi:hypothetical protein
MYLSWFNGSAFLSHLHGFAYTLLVVLGGRTRLQVDTCGIEPVGDGMEAPTQFSGSGDLVVTGPGGQKDTFEGIELAPNTGKLDRARAERRDRFSYPVNHPPRAQLTIGNRRQVQPGALGDRCKIKFDEGQAPAHLLGAEHFINVHGESVLRFALLRRDEFSFMQKLLDSMPAPEGDLIAPFTIEYSGKRFPIDGTTCARIYVRQRLGVFVDTLLPEMEEHVGPAPVETLLRPRFSGTFARFLEREKEWQEDPHVGISGDIVEVADLIVNQGAFPVEDMMAWR